MYNYKLNFECMFVLNMKVAWSVTRTTSFTGVVDPVQFPVVLVNEGNAWQTTSHTVIIPRQGYYFLHLGVGINTGQYMTLFIVVNGGAHVIVLQVRLHRPMV